MGVLDGTSEGIAEGASDGASVGTLDGTSEGIADGLSVGPPVGVSVGAFEGVSVKLDDARSPTYLFQKSSSSVGSPCLVPVLSLLSNVLPLVATPGRESNSKLLSPDTIFRACRRFRLTRGWELALALGVTLSVILFVVVAFATVADGASKSKLTRSKATFAVVAVMVNDELVVLWLVLLSSA